MSKLSDLIRKAKKRHFCSAVIVAAGASARAGRDKLFTELGGMPVLARTLSVFEACGGVDEVIVVTREDKIIEVADLCRAYGLNKVVKILCGGETRLHSALAGVSETNPRAELIAIHDGARPFVTPEVIEQAIHAALLYKAAAPAVSVKDTLKQVESDFAVSTVPRAETKAVQTPQVFQAALIKAALTNAVNREIDVTDDCAAAELLGVRVRLIPGSEENIKITTPLDFKLADAILESRQKNENRPRI